MALKFAVLLVLVAASTVFAYPPWVQQFSEEQERPPWLDNQFAEKQQISEEQERPPWLDNQFADKQQFSEEQQRPPYLDTPYAEQQQIWLSRLDKSTIAQEIERAEQQARCHPVTVFFVSVGVCQQTATECGSVTVKVGTWADVDVKICRKGEEPSIVHDTLFLRLYHLLHRKQKLCCKHF